MNHLRGAGRIAHSRWRRLLPLCLVIVCSALSLQSAQAAFIGEYSIDKFTVTNVNGDGFAETPDAGQTLKLHGPDNGSGDFGYTDFTVAAAAAGLVTFDFLYTSLDFPGNDEAGYLINNQYIAIANSHNMSGTIDIPVNVGDIFGFSILSSDNTFGEGILTITNFSAPLPPTGSDVPEPGTLSLLTAAAGVIVFRLARSKRQIES